MINNANIIRSIFLSLFLCLIHNLYGQTATPEYALEVSDAFFDIQYGITPLFEDITPIMDGETTCLYQIRYQNGEWCIISADMSIDPILAYGLSNIDEFSLCDAAGVTVYQSAGSIGDDGVAYLWDGTNMNYGLYYGNIRFKNSYGRELLQNQFPICVLSRPSKCSNKNISKSVRWHYYSRSTYRYYIQHPYL